MAKTRPSIAKRNRERARADKRRQKQAKRGERRHIVKTTDQPENADPDYDPDIAGIVPGPQPLPWADELEDEEPAADDNAGDQGQSPGADR